MRKWREKSSDSVEKFAGRYSCNCSNYTCRPIPTHDIGEQAVKLNTKLSA